MTVSKRKVDGAEATIEPCLLSAFNANTFNTVNNAAIESSPKEQPNGDSKRGKRVHVPSHQTSDSINNFLIESTKVKDNGNRRCGKNFFSASTKSRLQWLQNHNIMHNVMLFLDEVDLFHLENTHSEIIGLLSFARQWSHLSHRDDNKITYAHNRWRPTNEMDTEFVLNQMESIESKAVDHKDEAITDKGSDCDTTMLDHPCRDDLLARCIGRNFAEEAIFVRDREKEASHIYNFNRHALTPDDIPISSIESAASSWRQHWAEWYDYRANSVNGKDAFVRFSLRDGSGRFWQGFRGLTTNYNTTFFRMQFDMKELIEDMHWTELESYLQSDDEIFASMQSRLQAMESLMKMTQITVSVCGKLLVATGGYSPRFGDVSENARKCYFHNRHYKLPLADTTKNDLHWMPYQICLAADPTQNELSIEFDCDHSDLPFMKAEDIGKPNAFAHW